MIRSSIRVVTCLIALLSIAGVPATSAFATYPYLIGSNVDGFRINAPASIAGVKPARNSSAFDWTGKSPITGGVFYPASQPTGCVPFTASNAAQIAGKIVFLEWIDDRCGDVARVQNVTAAGGIGVIIVDNSEDFDLVITGSVTIPAVSTPQWVGAEMKAAVASGTVNVTLTPEYNAPRNIPPTMSVNNTTVEGNTVGGWTLDFGAIGTTSDTEDAGGPTVTCIPPIGSVLALGPNLVECTATDSGNLRTTATGTITVQDTTDPVITCPANITGIIGQHISLGTPGTTDIVDVNPTLTNNAPAVFGPGTTFIVWMSTDDSSNSASCTQTVTLRYAFTGFAQPIDTNQPNAAKAGQSIPVKWRLTDANGNPVTNLTSVQVSVSNFSCTTITGTDDIEEYVTSTSGLQNLGNGYYQYNWKTPKSYAGSCKTLLFDLGDGTVQKAAFRFN